MNPAGVETIHKLHNDYVKCTTVSIILQLFVQLHCKYEPLYILNVTTLPIFSNISCMYTPGTNILYVVSFSDANAVHTHSSLNKD